MQLSAPAAELYERVLLTMSLFEGVRAVGLVGSRATGNADPFSDLDLLVLSAKSVPPGEVRLQHYKTLDVKVVTVDHDLEAVRYDGLSSVGIGLDLYWCSQPGLEVYLRDLGVVFGGDESLAVSLATTEPAYDPDGLLDRIRRQMPAYPEERAVYRVRRSLQAAHRVFHVTRALEVAAIRDDVFEFGRVCRELLERLVTCLFALNRRWFGGGKRLDRQLSSLRLHPADHVSRLTDISLYRRGHEDLAACHDAILGLYEDVRALALREFGPAAMPVEWH